MRITIVETSIMVLLSLVFGCLAVAADLEVPGTYATIQAAVDAASDGDTIILADIIHSGAGNYDIEIRAKSLTICSAGGVPENCIIDCNRLGRGFEIRDGAEVTLQGVTMENGNLSGQGGGGAVYLHSDSSLTADRCIFKDNTAYWYGGAIYARPGAGLSLTRCTFTGNRAEKYKAGAIYMFRSSDAAFNYCTFAANTAKTNGGAIEIADSAGHTGKTITFRRCSFSRNLSEKYGGALYLDHCSDTDSDIDIEFINCIFADNSSAFQGGGVWAASTAVTFVNCTFTANTVTGTGSDGGAVWYSLADSSTLEMVFTNCIFWGDQAMDKGDEIFATEKAPVITWSDIADSGYSGGGNISSDPKFVDAAAGDFHLDSSSPCIDAGTAAGAPSDDYDGYVRPAGSGYDMGAYEYHEGGNSGDCPIWVDANGVKHLNGIMIIENQGKLVIQ